MTHLQLIHGRLQEAAYKITDNFCYSCYKVVEGGHCPDCGSDDFMRHLSGVGVEYGTEWVIGLFLLYNQRSVCNRIPPTHHPGFFFWNMPNGMSRVQ